MIPMPTFHEVNPYRALERHAAAWERTPHDKRLNGPTPAPVRELTYVLDEPPPAPQAKRVIVKYRKGGRRQG